MQLSHKRENPQCVSGVTRIILQLAFKLDCLYYYYTILYYTIGIVFFFSPEEPLMIFIGQMLFLTHNVKKIAKSQNN